MNVGMKNKVTFRDNFRHCDLRYMKNFIWFILIIWNIIWNFYLKTEFSKLKIQVHNVIPKGILDAFFPCRPSIRYLMGSEDYSGRDKSSKIHFLEFIDNIIYIINCIASIRIDFAFGEGFVTSFEATINSNLTISRQKIVI